MASRILFGGPIFESDRGAFLDEHMVVVDDDRVAAVEPVAQLPGRDADYELVDVAGACILPGLVDCHWHLISRTTWAVTDEMITMGAIEGVLNAERVIGMGITTVRDPGCRHRGIHALKRAIEDGLVKGPRAFVAGPNPTGDGAPPEYRNVYATGVDAIRRVVREEWRAGSDWIKLFISEPTHDSDWGTIVQYLSAEEIAAAVQEAHAKGLRTGCHLEGLAAARDAVAAGMDTIDRGTVLDEELCARMAGQGTSYVPTLWAFSVETQLAWGNFGPEKAETYVRVLQDEHRRSVQRALSAGVLIGAGTDSIDFIPARDAMAREVEMLVACGMSPVDALRAATINGATIIGEESSLGSLAPGKLADIVVVDGHPMQDLTALERPLLVVKGGEVLVDLRGDEEVARRAWTAAAASSARIDMAAAMRRGS